MTPILEMLGFKMLHFPMIHFPKNVCFLRPGKCLLSVFVLCSALAVLFGSDFCLYLTSYTPIVVVMAQKREKREGERGCFGGSEGSGIK